MLVAKAVRTPKHGSGHKAMTRATLRDWQSLSTCNRKSRKHLARIAFTLRKSFA